MSRVCVQKYNIGAMYSIGGGDGTRTNFPLHIWAVGTLWAHWAVVTTLGNVAGGGPRHGTRQ